MRHLELAKFVQLTDQELRTLPDGVREELVRMLLEHPDPRVRAATVRRRADYLLHKMECLFRQR